MEEKRVPVVGDMWRVMDKEVVLTCAGRSEFCVCSMHIRWTEPSGKANGWCSKSFLKYATFVRSAAPPEEREDWARWLPDRPLPNTGEKVLRVGQVWAWHEGGVGAGVCRIADEIEQRLLAYEGEPRKIAIGDGKCYFSSASRALVAILVADVGCEPTDPSVLYGKPASPPVVEAPRFGNERPHHIFTDGRAPHPVGGCLGCTATMIPEPAKAEAPRVKRDWFAPPLGERNYGRALMLEQGPGLAAKYANPCRLANCGHRRCTSQGDGPWIARVDDFDLLPDASR